MKIKKILLMGIIGIFCFSTTGCKGMTETKGFTIISEEKKIDGFPVTEVMDNETKIHYYVNTSSHEGFMCPVYKADGTIKKGF